MAKPKPKSPEEKQAALDHMLSMAATTNHLDRPGAKPAPADSDSTQASSPAPEPTSGNEEQKGEKVKAAPAAEAPPSGALEPATTPAPETITPAPASPASVPEPTPTQAPTQAPTSAPPVAPGPELAAPVVPEAAPAATVPKVENVPEIEHSPTAIPAPETTVEGGKIELASLFIPSGDKKVFTMRLTDAHYQYLLLLGTIVGNGASPPDIVHNIIAQFIDKNDAQIQKAITKQLRQRQVKK